MAITIALNSDCLSRLDLSPVKNQIDTWQQEGTWLNQEQQVSFSIDYPTEPNDPREFPEIPEVRLWFLRLDTVYPWMLFFLDWKAGELTRYAAMLVPHEFSTQEGIQYNPEALEIFIIQKVFVLSDWLKQQGLEGSSRLKAMAQVLGYELDDTLFNLTN